jgi:hypothetical protein
MIRKLNYTKRKKVARERVDIKLYNVGGIRSFDAVIDLDDLRLPSESRIYVEPYFKTSFMRFSFGTVGHQIPPVNRELHSLPDSDIVLFRVKVVDEAGETGKILALADGVPPSNLKDAPINKSGILPVNFDAEDLGEEIWRLNMNGDIPVLDINRRIDERKELVRSGAFVALVYPNVVRMIAYDLAGVYEEFSDGSMDWQGQWIRFIREVLGVTYGPDIYAVQDDDEEEIDRKKDEWASFVSQAFCRKLSTLRKISENIDKLLS